MTLLKFFKTMGILTSLALVYIHLQMQIIDLAYRGKVKQHDIRDLKEVNENVTSAILTLKSPNHLGQKLLTTESGMQFADSQNVIQVATSKEFLRENVAKVYPASYEKKNPFASLVAWGTQAEARGQE